jgi:hypothetical protein
MVMFSLPEDLEVLMERIAENVHENWAVAGSGRAGPLPE